MIDASSDLWRTVRQVADLKGKYDDVVFPLFATDKIQQFNNYKLENAALY